MKIKSVIFVISLFVLFTSCGKKTELTNVDKGMEYIEKQQYEEAIQSFEMAADVKQELQLAYRGMGIAYLEMKSYDKAIEYLQLALDQSKGKIRELEIDICYYKAESEVQAGKYEEAIKTYSALLEYDNKHAQGYFLRGRTYLELGKQEEGLKDFKQAVAVDNTQYDLYLYIYQALENIGLGEEGNKYLIEALEIPGDESENMLGKGRVYLKQGDYNQAKTQLESAMGKGNEEALFYLGEVHEALGDLESAQKAYQECIEKGMADGSIYNGLGLVQMKFLNYQEAIKSFQSGIKSGTKNALQELKFNEIVAYERAGDFATAKMKIESYLQEYPEDKEAVREDQFLQTR